MLDLDRKIFHFLNTTISNSFFDHIMPTLTDLHKVFWVQWIIFPALLAFWFYKKKKAFFPVFLGLLITVAATDILCYRLLKPTFKRDRPPAIETQINIRAKSYAGYSFPSNHAANNMAVATFLSLCYPALTPFLFLIAIIGAFSRIYVGVHYPSDVLGGAIIGILIGLLFFKLFKLTQRKFLK